MDTFQLQFVKRILPQFPLNYLIKLFFFLILKGDSTVTFCCVEGKRVGWILGLVMGFSGYHSGLAIVAQITLYFPQISPST